LNFPI